MSKKITSVEELAAFTQNELLTMGGRIAEGFENVDKRFDAMIDTLDLMRADLREIRLTLGPLVKNVMALEETVRQLTKRVVRLEDRVGLK